MTVYSAEKKRLKIINQAIARLIVVGENNMDKDEEVGILWERTSIRGVNFLSGKIHKTEETLVNIYPIKSKNPKGPKWKIVKFIEKYVPPNE